MTVIPVIFLSLLLISGAWGQSGDFNTIDGIRANVNLAKTNVAHLERIEPWLLFLLVLSLLLGAVTLILNASHQAPWVRWTTVVMGAAITLVGGLKTTVFRIDYATCDSAVFQVKSLITLLEGDLDLYRKPEVSPEDRVKTWLRIVRNEGLLETFAKMLKESGQPILPVPGFLLVVHAQSPQAQQRVAVNYSFQQHGTAMANNRQAAYKYAKYRALEALVLRFAPSFSGSILNSAIDYFNRFGDTIGSKCNPGQSPQVTCEVDISVPSLYLRDDVLKKYGAWDSPPPELLLQGSAVLRPKQSSVTVTVDEGRPPRGAGKFQFSFATGKSGKGPELRLTEIRCFQGGRWIFEVNDSYDTLWLPLNDYDDGGKPTTYDVSKDNRILRLPVGAQDRDVGVLIAGYRPEPAASK